jgi:hypothetical protein
MFRAYYTFLIILLIIAAACSGTDTNVASEDTSEQNETVVATETAQPEKEMEAPKKETAPPAAAVTQKPRPQKQEPVPEPPAPEPQAAQPSPPEPAYATVPAGTIVPIRLLDSLDSGVNKSGDSFHAVVDRDIQVGNDIVIPRGSQVEGKLTFVQQSGRVQGRAAMSMQFTALQIGERSYPILSNILSFEAESTKKEDVAKVGIGSGIGAVVGAIAGGGKGAAIGAAVGAGAGGATVAATRGKELKYEAEQPFEFTLNEDVQIRVR